MARGLKMAARGYYPLAAGGAGGATSPPRGVWGRSPRKIFESKRLRNVVFLPLFPPSLPPSPSSPPLPSSSLPPLFFPSLPFPFPSFPTPLKSKLYNYMPPLYFKPRAKSRVKTPPFPSFFSPPFFPPFPYAAFYNYFGASKVTGRS